MITNGSPMGPPSRRSLSNDKLLMEKSAADDDRKLRILSWVSLSLLVFQNCSAVLLMRWTQTRRGSVPYSPAAVIVVTEMVKLVVCVFAIVQQGINLHEIFKGEPLKMIIPAGLYSFQNNLLFVALANLEATLFQVTYQTKLLMTALLMVLMLGKRLSVKKWVALVVLFAGIVLTQLDAKKATKQHDADASTLSTGVIAVLASAMSSGIASVYFEKIVKNASTSLLVRNVQLAFFSIFMGFAAFPTFEGRELPDFFNGFDRYVILLVFVQAAGGLIVAAVIKYADNILKGFATAMAIVVSGIVSYLFLDFMPTVTFLSGVLLVLGATGMYSLPDS
jgi:UDP-sugar transporter A1/2/3